MLEVHGRRHGKALVLTLHNRTDAAIHVKVKDAYGPDRTVRVAKRGTKKVSVDVSATQGWYDVLATVVGQSGIKRGLAGRFENGRASTSDPQLGR